ncbi:hypothetical protein CRUP_001044 [Coryphaenoides rupestris]|nr:hypothetical protein CRUP_001044 [Coryphaenoides rupestris]
MRPRDVAVFSEDVSRVVDDLVKRVGFMRRRVAAILYESRLGCLEEEVPRETEDYIGALHLMFNSFKTTMYAGAIPRWLRPLLPGPWDDFCSSWDGLFNFSQVHVGRRLEKLRGQMERGEDVRGGLLTHMLVTMEMSLEEIYANVTEMLLAGVDTTSFTLTWAVYMLALNEEVQQEIYEEVLGVLGAEETPTADHVPRLPLVRGLVKETLRLFPVLPGNGRVTQDDLVVGGYFIPKGTQLALCHYATSLEEQNFPGAGDFQPARWVRKNNTNRVDNFGSIPFRMDVSPLLSSGVKAKTHGLLCPGAPIHIRFRDRGT